MQHWDGYVLYMLFILASQRQKGGFYMLYCSNKYRGSKTKLWMVLKIRYTQNMRPVNKKYPGWGGELLKESTSESIQHSIITGSCVFQPGYNHTVYSKVF